MRDRAALRWREEAAVAVDVCAELVDPPVGDGGFEQGEHVLVGDIDGPGIELVVGVAVEQSIPPASGHW